jgi:hypothetical protein
MGDYSRSFGVKKHVGSTGGNIKIVPVALNVIVPAGIGFRIVSTLA